MEQFPIVNFVCFEIKNVGIGQLRSMTIVRHRYAISDRTLVSQRKPDLFITNFLR